MRANGLIIKSMAKGFSHGNLEIAIKVNGRMICVTVRVNSRGVTGTHSRANSL